MKNKRYTIGFIFGDFYGAYTANLFLNIVKACRQYGQNIIGFGGGFLKSSQMSVLGENCNFIFDLVNKQNVDGIIVEGSIGNFIPKTEMQEFLLKYSGIPIVNISTNLEGVNNILIDNKKGMEDLVTHIVEYHNYKKIAFIKGTEGNFDAIERFEVYKNVLSKNNIEIDENLIVNGNFSYFGGVQAFNILFETRKSNFEAIISSNDYMALSCMREMQKRDIKIPENIAITGFDDTEECWTAKPTLTTVKQPFYDIGQESVKMLISILSGKNTPKNITIPTQLIIRESCGCKAVDKLNHIIRNYYSFDSKSNNNYDLDKKNQFIYELEKNINSELPYLKNKIKLHENLIALVDSYYDNIDSKNKDQLLEVFLKILKTLINNDEEIITINKFISIFYSNLINKVISEENKNEIIQIWNETVTLFGLLIQEDLSEKRTKFKLESHVLFDINENFINTFNMEKLKSVVLDQLPNFQFKNFFICLFEDDTLEKARVLISYDKEQKEIINYDPFPSKDLLPNKINKNNFNEYIIMALNFKDEYFGYVIYNIQTLYCFIYESLSVQISGAIKGAKLTNQLYEYTNQLEDKVKERTLELEIANKKLKELDSLKNDFIANITHDFRSPLTAILNIADLSLKFDKDLNEENKENYNIIYRASLRLKSSIDKLLELAKMDAKGIKLKIKKIEIISFINNVLNFYSSSVINSKIQIIRKLPDKKIDDFYTDPEKLQDIIDNIISNSIKFVNPDNGIIICQLEENKNNVVISISDNGIGIPKNKLETIFNRFEQAHNGRNSLYRGTGIGLAFAKQLIGYLKGRIWAESEGEGKGSKFFIELPKGKDIFDEKDFSTEEVKQIRREETETIIKSEIDSKLNKEKITNYITDLNKENELNFKKGLILIIDDDKSIREIVLKYLKNHDYINFIIAADGKQGLDAVYEYFPDLIISDFNMPNIKGDEFHNQLLDNPKFKDIPFIFLSAVADEKLIVERREKGAVAYLKKPIEEKLLILTVEEQLKKYFELKKIMLLATKDELTGLYNRRSIIDNLKRELSIRKYRDISILFFDVDNFKEINDTHGHQAGDLILSSISRIVQSSIRKYDIAGRYGGDEFIIILPETNLTNSVHVAEILKKAIKNNIISYNGTELSVTSSFGVASLKDNAGYIKKKLNLSDIRSIFEITDTDNTNWQEIEKNKDIICDLLINMADNALYQAKKTECLNCGFKTEKSSIFTENKCPQCSSKELIIGRNKVIKFE